MICHAVRRPAGLVMPLLLACASPSTPQVDGVSPLWRAPQATPSTYLRAAPLVLGSRVYSNVGGDIGAYDARSGARLWTVRVGPSPEIRTAASLVESNGLLIAAGADLAAVDTVTRRLAWSRPLTDGAAFAGVIADSVRVVVGLHDGTVQAFSVRDGAPLWQRPAPSSCVYQCIVRGLSRSGDSIYVSIARDVTSGGSVAQAIVEAVRAIDGSSIWRYASDTTRTTAPSGTIVVGRLLISSDIDGRSVYAIDRLSGTLAWRTSTPGTFLGPVAAPGAAGDTLFVGNANGDLLKLLATSGQIVWQGSSGQLLVDVKPCGGVVLATNGFLYVRARSDGAIRGVFRASGESLSSEIQVSNGVAYVNGQVNLYAFDCSRL